MIWASVKRLFFIRISSFDEPRKFYVPGPLFPGGITALSEFHRPALPLAQTRKAGTPPSDGADLAAGGMAVAAKHGPCPHTAAPPSFLETAIPSGGVVGIVPIVSEADSPFAGGVVILPLDMCGAAFAGFDIGRVGIESR